MFTATLFLALEVTPFIQTTLNACDPEVFKAFVKNDQTYLQDLTYKGVRYLGKSAGNHTDLASLELLEANIRTLLTKILPPEDIADLPLHLFPLIEAKRHARK